MGGNAYGLLDEHMLVTVSGKVALRWVILVGGLGVGPWSWPISPWVRTMMDTGLELILCPEPFRI